MYDQPLQTFGRVATARVRRAQIPSHLLDHHQQLGILGQSGIVGELIERGHRGYQIRSTAIVAIVVAAAAAVGVVVVAVAMVRSNG